MTYIRVSSLDVTYRQNHMEVEAVKNVNLQVDSGEFAVVIGPSGCGKSTLLYVLAGLVKAEAGEVFFSQEPIVSCKRDTALILQDYGLLPWKTVLENAALGLRIRGIPKGIALEKTRNLLRDLGIEELSTRYPLQLSGGQRQRVAIARALAMAPRLLLMDEPFSSLDALTRETLQMNLLDIWQRTGITILLVTHSIEEAVFLGQKIYVMSRSPGTITAVVENSHAGDVTYRGKREFYDTCANLRSLLQ
ncbi:MAG: ABC transporter ATP-binding protein [Bacillota bacterium]